MAEIVMIRCPACGATNRIPSEKIVQGLEPVCGRCKTPLPVSARPVTVTDATFASTSTSGVSSRGDRKSWSRTVSTRHASAAPMPIDKGAAR